MVHRVGVFDVRETVRMGTKSSKRELIEPTLGNKRYVRRDAKGRFPTSLTSAGRRRRT